MSTTLLLSSPRNIENKDVLKLSYEYIRGLTEGEGCFTFCSVPTGKKLPTFILSMSERDKDLLKLVRDTLGLRNRIYQYTRRLRRDKYNHAPMCVLIVRDFGQIKNIIVPLFYKKLRGHKAKQFEIWLEKMGNDPIVQENYQFIYKIHKAGFYDKNLKFI